MAEEYQLLNSRFVTTVSKAHSGMFASVSYEQSGWPFLHISFSKYNYFDFGVGLFTKALTIGLYVSLASFS